MKNISIPATIANILFAVEVTFPHGSAGVGHIYIEDWFQGQVTRQTEGWHVYLNHKTILSVEDAEILVEALIKYRS